ncbi:hypothetical protein ACOME3_002031 [Neoechinorhynchus agilis]
MFAMSRFVGVMFAIASAFLFSVNSFVFSLIQEDLYFTHIAFFQYGICIIVLVIWSFVGHQQMYSAKKTNQRYQNEVTDWRMIGFLLAVGTAAACVSLCLTGSFNFVEVAEALALFFTYSVWTLILARIFLKEALGVVNILCCVFAVLGVLFVMKPPFIFGTQNSNTSSPVNKTKFTGYALSLMAAMFLGIHNVLVSNVSRRIPFTVPLFYCTAINFLFALVISIIEITQNGFKVKLTKILFWICLTPVTYLFAQICLIKALQKEDAGLVGALGAVNIISIVGLRFAQSKITSTKLELDAFKISGIGLIVAVVVVSGLYKYFLHKRSQRVDLQTDNPLTEAQP